MRPLHFGLRTGGLLAMSLLGAACGRIGYDVVVAAADAATDGSGAQLAEAGGPAAAPDGGSASDQAPGDAAGASGDVAGAGARDAISVDDANASARDTPAPETTRDGHVPEGAPAAPDAPGVDATSAEVGPLTGGDAVASGARVITGTYVGDGADDRLIASLPLRPAAVIVRPAAIAHTFIRTSVMPLDRTKLMGATRDDLVADVIQSFTADGFVVGTAANAAGVVHHFVAFAAVDGEIAVGSYVGASGPLPVNVGFAPAHVMAFRAGYALGHRSRAMNTSLAVWGTIVPELIRSLDPMGFTVGDSALNVAGATHYYLAVKEGSVLKTGSYIGDGRDDRDLAGLGLQPEFAVVQCESPEMHFAYMKTRASGADRDESYALHRQQPFANFIQRLLDMGLQVGNNRSINYVGNTCHYAVYAR
jgi:hypothetical protein